MFSRLSADRFEKVQESNVGPGSYEIPTALDDHAPLIAPGDRFQEAGEASVGSVLRVYEDPPAEKAEKERKSRPTSRTPFGNSKENRVPNSVAQSLSKGLAAPLEALELEQLRRRLATEEKLRVQAEAKAQDSAMAKKSAANAHAQLQAKDKKVDELQKKVDELTATHKEAMRRNCELETEKGAKRKALVEKEQAIAGLQKTLDTAKVQLEERGRKLEEVSTQAASSSMELENSRKEVSVLREKLSAAALDEKQFEETSDELAAIKEAAAEQAKWAEAALEEAKKECAGVRQAFLEKAMTSFDGLGERLFGQAESMESGLQQLAEEHERLRQCAAEKVKELHDRNKALEAALRKSRAAEAELASKLAVSEASLAAAISLREEERAKQEEELRLAREEERAEGERRLGGQLAELRGRLYTAESARDLSQASQKELERQLAQSTEAEHLEAQELQGEVARLQAALEASEAEQREEQEAREDLERQLEAQSAACIQAQAQAEAAAAEAESLRASRQEEEARNRAHVQELEEALQKEAEARREQAVAAAAQAKRAEEDLASLERACEDERHQNRNLISTVEVLRRDATALQAENQALQESEAALREEVEGAMDERANLAGHANHRQKIKYTQKLKEDNLMLRAELQKAQKCLAQLKVGGSAGAIGRSPAGAAKHVPPSPRPLGDAAHQVERQPSAGSTRAPRRSLPVQRSLALRSTPQGRPPVAATSGSAREGEEVPLTAAEATRRCRMQERAMERLKADYQHLVELLEHTSLADKGETSDVAGAVLEKLRHAAAAAPGGAPPAGGEVDAESLRKDLAGRMEEVFEDDPVAEAA